MKKKMITWCGSMMCAAIAVGAATEPFTGPREVPDTFFGTSTHWNSDWVVGAMKDLGLTCARVDFVHEALEPAEGTYDFSDGQWIIQSTELGLKAHLDLLGVVVTNKTYDRIEKNPAAFEKFGFSVATKYRGRNRYWEAGNEPDMTILGKKYVTMLKAFHKGIKRADPNNRVVLAGFLGDEAANFATLYKLGGKGYFDIVNSHSYTRPRSPEEGGYVKRIKELHHVMRQYGDNKPCWVTEIGWNGVEPSMLAYLRTKSETNRDYLCSDEDQARYLARTYLLSASIPWIERVYFFQLAVDPAYPDIRAWADDYIGIYLTYGNQQIAPKTGYYSLKTVIGLLKGATYRESLNMGQRIYAMTFSRKDQAFVALWSLDDNVTLPVDDISMVKGITSMVGTPMLVTKNLPLSGRPIYLTVDAGNLDRLKRQIMAACPVGAQGFAMALALDTTRSTAAMPIVQLTLTNNRSQSQAAPVMKVDVAPPWRLNVSPKDAVPFAGNETRRYQLAVIKPTPLVAASSSGVVSLDVSAWLPDAEPVVRTVEHLQYVVFPPAPEAGRPITLGLSDSEREMMQWKGAADCSATWQCSWDRQNLYFTAAVRDDSHVQSCTADNASLIWQGDSIQIALDLGGDAKPCSNVPQYDGVNDVEFGFALGSKGPTFCIWDNPNGATGPMPLQSLTITRDANAKVTHYQAAIPWSLFGWTKELRGAWMGFNVVVNDYDGTERTGCLQWTPGISQTKDPSRYHKALLSGTRANP